MSEKNKTDGAEIVGFLAYLNDIRYEIKNFEWKC